MVATRRKKKTTARRKPVRRARRRSAGVSAPRLLWPLLLRITLGLIICFGGFLLYLDREIQQHFEVGVHPQPAHIYARPTVFAPNSGLSLDQVVSVLKSQGYRKVNKIDSPGSYVVADNRMDLSTNLPAAESDQNSVVRLEFNRQGLTRILDHGDGNLRDSVALEAAHIGSLQLGPYEDRIALKLHQMPELLIQALLAMEDRNFDQHVGVDLVAIGRALVNNLIRREALQGGSTITQQLVKNLFLSPERSLSRKVLEALMAITMEMRYSKAEILELYVNEIFLGQAGNRAVHGFALASEYYFARPLQQLRLHETALLVGMIPAPSFYNPRRHPERALRRRNLVLDTLAKVGGITSSTAATLRELPLSIAPHRNSADSRFPAYVDYLHRQTRQYFSEEVLRRDGIRLFTTLDASIQTTAQQALSKTLTQLEQDHSIKKGMLQGAAIVVDVKSGDILALVGDRQAGYSGFNRAVDAQRPIGSLVKPLVYLSALEQPERFSLATVVEDTPITLTPPGGKPWSPQNYDKTFRGTATLLEALTRSYNVPTVRVGLAVGVNVVIETINRLGIRRSIKDYPSLLLGANDHSPLEVAQLYQSIANHGERAPLRSLSQITDRSGKVIARFPESSARVIEPGPAYLIDYALKQVVRRGTAARLSSQFDPGLQLAGKTGTTDDYRDSWFAGYSGNLVTVVWVGRDDNKPIGLTGSGGAMRVWQSIMSELWLQPGSFDPPEDVAYTEIDPTSGLLARAGCEGRISLPVLSASRLTDYAPCGSLLGRVKSWFDITLAEPATEGAIWQREIEDKR